MLSKNLKYLFKDTREKFGYRSHSIFEISLLNVLSRPQIFPAMFVLPSYKECAGEIKFIKYIKKESARNLSTPDEVRFIEKQ